MPPRGVLQHRAFFAVYVASVVSNVGTFVQDVGEAWLMINLHGTPLQVALVTSTTWGPTLFLSLFAGVLADRMDRRVLICGAQLWSALVALVLAALSAKHLVTPTVLLACTTALGVGNALIGPAWWTFVSGLVPPRDMPEAVALQSTSWNIARAVGPALGGLVVARLGPAFAFTLNALSFVFVVIAIARAPHPPITAAKTSMWRSVREGLDVFRRTRDLRVLSFTTSAFALVASPILSLLPAFVAKDLAGTGERFGLALGSFGAGAVLGAVGLARARRTGKLSPAVLAPLCMAVHGAAALGLSQARAFPLACAALVPAGATWLSLLSTENALLQGLSPAPFRGRVKSIDTLLFLGLYAVGGVIAGTVANAVGVRAVLVLSGVLVLSCAAVVALFARWPTMPDEAAREAS